MTIQCDGLFEQLVSSFDKYSNINKADEHRRKTMWLKPFLLNSFLQPWLGYLKNINNRSIIILYFNWICCKSCPLSNCFLPEMMKANHRCVKSAALPSRLQIWSYQPIWKPLGVGNSMVKTCRAVFASCNRLLIPWSSCECIMDHSFHYNPSRQLNW